MLTDYALNVDLRTPGIIGEIESCLLPEDASSPIVVLT